MTLAAADTDTIAAQIVAAITLSALNPLTDPHTAMKIIVDHIYAGIIANALVSPAVNPIIGLSLNVTGTPVTGVGKII